MESFKRSFLEGLENIGELTGTTMTFVAIAGVSYGLGLLVHAMQANGGDAISIALLQFAERAVLLLDILGLLRRVLVHTIFKPTHD